MPRAEAGAFELTLLKLTTTRELQPSRTSWARPERQARLASRKQLRGRPAAGNFRARGGWSGGNRRLVRAVTKGGRGLEPVG